MPAAAPVVALATREIDVRWENTGVGGHRWGSVAALFVRARFSEVHDFLMGEVSHILGVGVLLCQGGGFESNGVGHQNVSFVSVHFAASGVHIDVMLNFFHVWSFGVVLRMSDPINFIVHD